MSIFVLLSQKLAAFAVMIQSMEYLILRRQFGTNGVWSWNVIGKEFKRYPKLLSYALGLTLGDESFVLHLVLRLALACYLLFATELNPPVLGALWLSTVLIAVRMRGTFNGGSDMMTAVVLGCLALGNTKFGIYYLIVQVTASYVVAGAVKFMNQDWRKGTALAHFMRTRTYGAPKWAGQIASVKWLAFLLSWFIILFECSFPLAFLSRELFVIFACLGIGFHLINFLVLGLNRFFWIWIAAYPVLYTFVQ